MRRESQEIICAIYEWTNKNLKNTKMKRDLKTNKFEKVMLAGKAKAYLDVCCFLRDRYSKKVTFHPRG